MQALAALIAGTASLPSFAEDAAKFDTGMIPRTAHPVPERGAFRRRGAAFGRRRLD